jgi:NAD(P)-dependent dehydrogenase (short-subunit alcohol dehydrogenase family)
MNDQKGAGPRSFALTGKVVVVTGATSGIGLATCRAALAAGAHLVAVGRRARPLDTVFGPAPRPSYPKVTETLGLSLDVREPDDMAEMAERTLDRFSRIDVLVASAGLLRSGRPTTVARLPVEEWDLVLDTNLRGVFLSNRAVLPAMLAQRQGTIVNLSSTSGRHGRAYDAPYCASKFGVIGISESLAEEVEPHGVKVHVLLPGPVDTDVWRQNRPLPQPPTMLSAERVANTVLYLISLPADTTITPFEVVPMASAETGSSPSRDEAPDRSGRNVV